MSCFLPLFVIQEYFWQLCNIKIPFFFLLLDSLKPLWWQQETDKKICYFNSCINHLLATIHSRECTLSHLWVQQMKVHFGIVNFFSDADIFIVVFQRRGEILDALHGVSACACLNWCICGIQPLHCVFFLLITCVLLTHDNFPVFWNLELYLFI